MISFEAVISCLLNAVLNDRSEVEIYLAPFFRKEGSGFLSGTEKFL